MARKAKATRERAPKGKDAGKKFKKKPCVFCQNKVTFVDYKDVNLLRRYMSDRAKIRARRVSGNCAQHQRDVATAIKTAREVALLPYTVRTMSEGRGRGGGGGRGRPDVAVEAPPPESAEDAGGEVVVEDLADADVDT